MDESRIVSKDQYRGCLLGLAFGDALGAKFEGGILERSLWALIGKSQGRMKYTDDTQMSLDIINSILSCEKVDQDHLARQFAQNYRWSRGYGPGAGKLLKAINKGADWRIANKKQFKDGSYGNGAAMRSPVLPLFYNDSNVLLKAVHKASEITHAHPSGIEGAKLVALTVFYGLRKMEPDKVTSELINVAQEVVFKQKLLHLQDIIKTQQTLSSKESIKVFGNSVAAENSSVTAIFTAFQFINQPYIQMVDFICKCGGDTDTIAAMAGAIWGAYNGFENMKDLHLELLETGESIITLADQVYNFGKVNE